MATTSNWAKVCAAGILGLGIAACQPSESDDGPEAELLHSWTTEDEDVPLYSPHTVPELVTSEDELRAWVSTLGGSRTANLSPHISSVNPNYDEYVLVAFGHRPCTRINGVHLDDLDGEELIRVDYDVLQAGPAECPDMPQGNQIWQIPREALGEAPPTVVATSTTPDPEEPRVYGAGRPIWSGHRDSENYRFRDFSDVFEEVSTRVYSTQEDLQDLIELLEEIAGGEPEELLHAANTSEMSYVLVHYDACGRSWMEVNIVPEAEPPIVQAAFMSNIEDCGSADERLEVWAVPDLLIGQGATVEEEIIAVDLG